MFFIDRMKTARMIEKALDAKSLRRKVVADNIANVDVPHFKRREVNFESELKRAIHKNESEDSSIKASLTDSRHIPFSIPQEISSVNPRINHDYNTSLRNDGNNVDIEKEMVDASENMMKYNLYVQRISSIYSGMKRVMQSG